MNAADLLDWRNLLLLQVNASLNFASLMGLFDLVFAVLYPVLVFSLLFSGTARSNDAEKVTQAILAIAVLPVLLLVGGILFFNGWRLDPILQFGVLLLHLLLFASLGKDFLLGYLRR